MQTHLVLTVIGPDRPGLVSALSNTIAAGGGNWLDSRMANLAGQFAGILLLDVESDRADGLQSRAPAAGRDGTAGCGREKPRLRPAAANKGQRAETRTCRAGPARHRARHFPRARREPREHRRLPDRTVQRLVLRRVDVQGQRTSGTCPRVLTRTRLTSVPSRAWPTNSWSTWNSRTGRQTASSPLPTGCRQDHRWQPDVTFRAAPSRRVPETAARRRAHRRSCSHRRCGRALGTRSRHRFFEKSGCVPRPS